MDEIVIGLVAGLVSAVLAAALVGWLRVGFGYCLIIGVLGGGAAGGAYARLGLAGDSPMVNGIVSGTIGGIGLLVIVRLFLAALGWNQGGGAPAQEEA